MNARERKKLFITYLGELEVPPEHLKVYKRMQVPKPRTIRLQFSLSYADYDNDADVIKHYAEFLAKHIKDPAAFMEQVRETVKKYMDLGLKPIPLHPGTKVPLGDNWQEKYLTLRKDQIPLVWTSIQNIGLKTGPPSNLLVLDFESEEAFQAFNEVLFNHPSYSRIAERIVPTTVEKTKRGVHVWYIVKDSPERINALSDINKWTHRFFKDFEIRWGEGQVAVTPSLHPGGIFYQWAEEDGVTFDPWTVGIRGITVADVALILDIYHKTGKLNINMFKLADFEAYKAKLLGKEEEFKAGMSYASAALVDFSTNVDNEQEARLLNALQKIWPEPGAGRWAASCGISALLGILGVPLDTAKRIIHQLAETMAPNDPWNEDLLRYVERTYRELESYKAAAEEAKKLGKPVPKLPVAFKSIMLLNTPFTEEELDNVRREVEKILGVSMAERLGLKKTQQSSHTKDTDNIEKIIQSFLLDDELMIATPTIEKTSFTDPQTGESVPAVKYKIPIVHYSGGTVRASTKIVMIAKDSTRFDPLYIYNYGNPLVLKPVKIEKLAYLEEDVYAKLRVGGAVFEGPIETVISELQRRKLLAPNKGSWVGSYLSFLAEKEKEEYFTVLGVVAKKDGLFEWIHPDHERYYPLNPSATMLARAMKKYVENASEELYEQFIKAIAEYKEFINDEAYWFGMSYLFIAPFLSAAATVFKLSPFLYLYNPVAGSGKSASSKFITQVGHGIKPFDKEVLDSNFRFLDLFSSIQGAVTFDEVGDIKKEILDLLIAAATGAGTSTRGRGISTLKEYEPKAVAVFTSNKPAWQLYHHPRWLDRVVQVKVEANTARASEFLTKIDEPFALSANDDKARVTVAHYFLPELVGMVNDLGGMKFLRERFKKWFAWGAENGLAAKGGRRTVHKFATFMVGLELMATFMKRKGVSIDMKEGARVIYEHFKEEASEIPRPLADLILTLATTKHPTTGEILLDMIFHTYKGVPGYVITTKELAIIRDSIRDESKKAEIPGSLSEIADLIALLGRYGSKKDIHKTFNLGGATRVKGVFISQGLVDDVLGIVRAIEADTSEDEEPSHEVLNEVMNILSMQDATFEELKQMTLFTDLTLAKALRKLEEMGLVWVRDGKYRIINYEKAQIKGFNIVEEIRG